MFVSHLNSLLRENASRFTFKYFGSGCQVAMANKYVQEPRANIKFLLPKCTNKHRVRNSESLWTENGSRWNYKFEKCRWSTCIIIAHNCEQSIHASLFTGNSRVITCHCQVCLFLYKLQFTVQSSTQAAAAPASVVPVSAALQMEDRMRRRAPRVSWRRRTPRTWLCRATLGCPPCSQGSSCRSTHRTLWIRLPVAGLKRTAWRACSLE